MEQIYLRPHHLLCTQTFLGKGYSEEFVENMTRITNILRTEKSQEIELMFSCDSLCACCPNKVIDNNIILCKSNDKVIEYDKNIADYFQLKQGKHNYHHLLSFIIDSMNPDLFKLFCQSCEWFEDCSNVLSAFFSDFE